MSALDDVTLATLDEQLEVDLRTPRGDGSVTSRPVWVVVVDGSPYVRSYLGERGAWYRHARRDGRLVLAPDGDELDLAAVPDADPQRNVRVSAAFRRKYGGRSPGPTAAMVTPEVVATTLRLEAAPPEG